MLHPCQERSPSQSRYTRACRTHFPVFFHPLFTFPRFRCLTELNLLKEFRISLLYAQNDACENREKRRDCHTRAKVSFSIIDLERDTRLFSISSHFLPTRPLYTHFVSGSLTHAPTCTRITSSSLLYRLCVCDRMWGLCLFLLNCAVTCDTLTSPLTHCSVRVSE